MRDKRGQSGMWNEITFILCTSVRLQLMYFIYDNKQLLIVRKCGRPCLLRDGTDFEDNPWEARELETRGAVTVPAVIYAATYFTSTLEVFDGVVMTGEGVLP